VSAWAELPTSTPSATADASNPHQRARERPLFAPRAADSATRTVWRRRSVQGKLSGRSADRFALRSVQVLRPGPPPRQQVPAAVSAFAWTGARCPAEASPKRFIGSKDGRMRPVRTSAVAGKVFGGGPCGFGVNTLAARSPGVDAEIALVAHALNTRLAAASGVSASSSRTSRLGRSSGDGSSTAVLQFACAVWSGLRLPFTSTMNGRACGFMSARREMGFRCVPNRGRGLSSS
jgi:hypothetical protein